MHTPHTVGYTHTHQSRHATLVGDLITPKLTTEYTKELRMEAYRYSKTADILLWGISTIGCLDLPRMRPSSYLYKFKCTRMQQDKLFHPHTTCMKSHRRDALYCITHAACIQYALYIQVILH